MKVSTVAAVIAVATTLAASPARAQFDSREAIELQHQILELKREVQQLRDQGPRSGGTASGGSFLGGRSSDNAGNSEITGQLLSRVEALEENTRRLRGRIDEVANQTQRQGEELSKQIGDIGFRVQSLEGGAPAARSSPGAAAALPPTTLPLPSALPASPIAARRTPEIAIQDGNAALARRDYVAAEAAAREVLNNNKTSPRAYDAQLLLAQALTGRKEFSQAAIAYDDSYKRSRRGARAPDALLGLANSLAAINEKRAACDTLNQLAGEFPSPRPDLRDGIASARSRAGCR